jgi:hypothetical protein
VLNGPLHGVLVGEAVSRLFGFGGATQCMSSPISSLRFRVTADL